MEQQYPFVNERDEILGHIDKEDAYKENKMLRSIQIFVFNSKGELYVQKRGKDKKRFGNYLCTSVAGHVEPEETYEQAAIRELKEELGLKTNNLVFLSKEKTPVGYNNYAMMAHFKTVSDDPIVLQEEEVGSGNFYTIEKIEQLILDGALFTPGFLYFFNREKSLQLCCGVIQ